MTQTHAKSASAADALVCVQGLQRRLVTGLEAVAAKLDCARALEPTRWLRDEGRHGGGVRYGVGDTALFNRASVNVSQVHYDDEPDKRLGSATALSAIVHPENPHAPSVHMHVSWTQMRQGPGYWRMMADLNPAIAHDPATNAFGAALRAAAPPQYEDARAQGDRYFYIPALDCHRGATHFYLEGYATDDASADMALAQRFAEAAIDAYCTVLEAAVRAHPEPTDADKRRQLAYHTLYLLQVLTLDRGTTSGLLIHSDNDVGTLGSLPRHVDRGLLASWRSKLPAPQDELLDALVHALPSETPALVSVQVKRALASAVRAHYTRHPQALQLQASGDKIPPTVQNHR